MVLKDVILPIFILFFLILVSHLIKNNVKKKNIETSLINYDDLKKKYEIRYGKIQEKEKLKKIKYYLKRLKRKNKAEIREIESRTGIIFSTFGIQISIIVGFGLLFFPTEKYKYNYDIIPIGNIILALIPYLPFFVYAIILAAVVYYSMKWLRKKQEAGKIEILSNKNDRIRIQIECINNEIKKLEVVS